MQVNLADSWHYLLRVWINVRRVRFWVVLAFVVYTLVGFFVVPWAAAKVAVDTVRADLGRELRIGKIAANPYTFTLEVTDVVLEDPDGHRLLAIERSALNFTLASVYEGAWTFQSVRLDRPVVRAERLYSGETRLARLIREAGERPAEASEQVATAKTGGPAVTIRDLEVTRGTIRIVDRLAGNGVGGGLSVAPSTPTLAVHDLGLTLSDASLYESDAFPVHVRGRLAAGGTFGFDGRVANLPSVMVDGALDVDALALSPIEPYLQRFVRVALASGHLSLDGVVAGGVDKALRYRGSAGIDKLSVVSVAERERVLGWRGLDIEHLELSLADRSIETSDIVIDAPSGHVVVRDDQSTSVGDLLVAQPASDGDSGGADESGDAAPFDINIGGIVVTEGDLHFADQSLPLPFTTRINELSGRLSTLASDTAAAADVALEGRVEDYGLARIEGAVHAWDPMRDTSLAVTFRNIPVAQYSPYTVAFVGRRIAAGRMDLKLTYTITDRRLVGRNALVLRDLELGNKIDQPGAMDLPLTLAVALLENRDGVIDMDIPVTGDVGAPQFELGGAIRQALVDAITNVITSPFSLLAGLIGADEEDLGRIAFPDGRSDLTPPQRQRVALLRQALAKRPELVIELAGPFAQKRDALGLQRRSARKALAKRLRQQGREVASRGLADAEIQATAEAMFAAAYSQEALQVARERFTRDSEEASEGETGFDAVAYRSHIAERIVAAQTVTDADLTALARARAVAVRDVLRNDATGGATGEAVDAERVRLIESESVEVATGQDVLMTLSLAAD